MRFCENKNLSIYLDKINLITYIEKNIDAI